MVLVFKVLTRRIIEQAKDGKSLQMEESILVIITLGLTKDSEFIFGPTGSGTKVKCEMVDREVLEL